MNKFVVSAAFGLIATIFFLTPAVLNIAYADNSCFLETSFSDVYVVVYEMDRSGNKGYQIWKGWVREDQQQSIRSDSGLIRFHYALSANQPLSGDVTRACEDDGVIGVP